MKIKFHSSILRYEGNYPSLSAFMMSASPQESDKEDMMSSPEGKFEGDENAFTLSYREEDGMSASLTYRAGELHFRRGATEACFIKGKSTSFSHFAGYGSLLHTVYTLRLEVIKRDDKYLVALSYLAHISGMVQKNTMMWKIN